MREWVPKKYFIRTCSNGRGLGAKMWRYKTACNTGISTGWDCNVNYFHTGTSFFQTRALAEVMEYWYFELEPISSPRLARVSRSSFKWGGGGWGGLIRPQMVHGPSNRGTGNRWTSDKKAPIIRKITKLFKTIQDFLNSVLINEYETAVIFELNEKYFWASIAPEQATIHLELQSIPPI